MAKGIHLFPYRTQKLSLSAPMVLGWRRPGRVGRCRIPKKKPSHKAELFLCPPGIFLPGRLQPSATLYLARFPIARRQWDRSLPPPVAETGRRSVGNRKEHRLRCDYASSPDHCPLRGSGSRSLPPAVRDEGRRSAGNRKERRLRRDYASFPDSSP